MKTNKERLAKLAGGVAKINVGTATESEMKEKSARIEDALHATRAVVEEGIPPGGGGALLRACSQVKAKGLSDDEAIGFHIVLRAARAPVTMISTNADQDGSIVCEKLFAGSGNFGYNAATNEYEYLVKAGVIDPTKVRRTALQNATRVSTLLLTSKALIAEKPKETKGKAGAPVTAATMTCIDARAGHHGFRPRKDRGGLRPARQAWLAADNCR